jgi:hypothetical protein
MLLVKIQHQLHRLFGLHKFLAADQQHPPAAGAKAL